MEYLIQVILPTNRTLAHQLRKLAVRYFLQNRILFKKGYNRDSLRCLGPREARETVKEVYSSDCVSHPGKRRLYRQLLQLGYCWPTMKNDSKELVKMCHACQVHGDAIHTHPNVLQDMTTPWSFYTWGLNLIRPINPLSNGHIWILTSVVDTVPYRPVRPEYTVPVGDPVRLTPTFRTGKITGRTGLVPAIPANTGQYWPV